MKNNCNNFDKTCDRKNKNLKDEQSYSYYSRLLNKPFDTVEELRAAEEALRAEQRAKEDKAAQKKADAQKVDEAFKALNKARKEYKDELIALTEAYSNELKSLKTAFEDKRAVVQNKLAAAEENYATMLKAFTEKYEQYHLSLKDGDFETTISSNRSTSDNAVSIFDIFDSFFGF